jgi:ATP-dependent Zn protease
MFTIQNRTLKDNRRKHLIYIKMAKNFMTILFLSMMAMMILIQVECFSAGGGGNIHSAGKKRDRM